MQPSDQMVKLRIVYLVAAYGLLGFFLEIGPVAGVFPQVLTGLRLELPAFGFIAYLALAASAIVALHLSEDEPTPKEDKSQPPPMQAIGEGGEVREYVRVRPDLQQLRVLFTALGGYAVLKVVSLIFMWQAALQNGVYPLLAFQFGLAYIGIGWFLLIQFLRWYAVRRRWVRLQDELVGVDVSRVVAIVILWKPLFFFVNAATRGLYPASTLYQIVPILLHFCLIAAGITLWFARPLILRRTIISLSVIGGLIILLTIIQAILERVLPAVYG